MKRTIQKALSLLFVFALLFTAAAPAGGKDADGPKTGDVDLSGDVTAADARIALRAAVGLETLSAEQALNADADRDGSVTAADARLILRVAVGLEQPVIIRAKDLQNRVMSENEWGPYLSDRFELMYLCDVTVSGRVHTVLSDYFAVNVPTLKGTKEEDLLNMVGVIYNENNEPFLVLPDATARMDGKFRFKTLHFTPVGAAKLTDAQLLDLWADRAAAQDESRRISEEEITPGLTDIIADGLKVNGLGADQYAGAIVRSILSLDTRGEILTAAVDGDNEGLKNKLVNLAGEYYLGKLFKGEEDQFLTKSLGDNMAEVKKSVKDGKFTAAAKVIADNILSNAFPMYNYSNKIAALTDKLADIWTDDMMNEQYDRFRKMLKEEGKVSDDDWNAIYIGLYGASHRLSARGVNAADLRRKFDQRYVNENKIAERKKELLKYAAEWRAMGLMDSIYWTKKGERPSDTQILSSLLKIRTYLKALFTLNGRFQRGKGYQTDGDFLSAALLQWVQYGPSGRAEFYQWVRSVGIYLPKAEFEEEEEYTGDNPFHPGVKIDDDDLPEVDDNPGSPVVVAH